MKLIEILALYKEEYDLNLKEGLIKTTELGKTLSILKRNFKDGYHFEKVDVNDFKVGINNDDVSTLDMFLVMLNNLGWFPSFIKSNSYKGKYAESILKKLLESDDLELVTLQCEAKYDIAVERIPKSGLYHVAPASAWNRIQRVGLVPKSRSKASFHPDRVYLAYTQSAAEHLAPQFYHKTGNPDWVLLYIDPSMIPGDYFKLYQDPNFTPNGFYTLNNIPPIAIEKIKDIRI